MTRTLDPASQPRPEAAPHEDEAWERPFRRRAVEQYQEPEQLDVMLRLTSPRLWLALAVALALIAAIVTWSFLGSDPQEVQATGVLLPGQGLTEVSATESGIVTDVTVRSGDVVAQGQSVASLRLGNGSSLSLTTENQGRVAFVLVEPGAFVKPGTLIAQLIPVGNKSDAIMFVDAGNGKLIRPGMSTHISPSTAPASQYGSIEGKVVSVSDVALSRARLQQLVANDVVNASLAAVGESVLEVRVDLINTSSTPSGYRWTSGRGAPFKITEGTPLEGSIAIRGGRPIDHLVG